MKAGFLVTVGSPREAAELAAAAEAAGWDGVFTWDGVAIGAGETYDPWVVLAAMAMRTEHVTLGAIITPPSRRRPWKLAREALSIDVLSGGRLVLPVGLGALDDAAFGAVGEPTDARTRGELLDESLAIIAGLWSGEPFGFEGRHYRFPPDVPAGTRPAAADSDLGRRRALVGSVDGACGTLGRAGQPGRHRRRARGDHVPARS